MSRMLAALRRIESEQSLAPSLMEHAVADSILRIDQPHATPKPESEFVATVVPTVVPTSSAAGCLSANAFWPSIELPQLPVFEGEGGSYAEQSSVASFQTKSTQDSGRTDPSPRRKSEVRASEICDTDSSEDKIACGGAVRQLASTILRKLPTGLPGTLWLTSAGDASEASRLVAELSQILCEEESLRVLAINAQCGRSAERVEYGLVQAIDNPDEWQKAVQSTAVDGLSILPGGIGTAARAEQHPEPLKPLLDRICCEFDIVLVDGGAASNPVTSRMAADCDAALVLVQLGETKRRYARQVIKSLKAAHANVLGCVLAQS